jgi:hypothetical protein
LKRNGFRVSPADYPWALMVDRRTIGKRVDGHPGGAAGDLGPGKLATCGVGTAG